MKILAIRGKNLASLAGDFEVDLEAGPLAGCGLFSISGATGSGKSTLLDAMCLALFEKVPRLQEAQGVRIGRRDEDLEQRITSIDPRQLLRRGTAGGFAEVDFEGVDSKRYRARWQVRRARNKVDGKLQNSELKVTELGSEQALTRTKTETLDLIEKKLGLSFDQFRRSVLLAQGDFAAFLKANEKERAELLERITGTDLYSRISIAAHERWSKENQELMRLTAGFTAIQVLSPEQRAEQEAKLDAARLDQTSVEARLAELEKAATFYATLVRLTDEARKAEEELKSRTAAVVEAVPLRAEVTEVERVEPLRAPLRAFDDAELALKTAQAGVEQTAKDLNVAKLELERMVGEKKLRLEAFTKAEHALQSAQPSLREAEALDLQLLREREALAKALPVLEAAEEKAVAAARAFQAREKQLDAAEKRLEEVQAWFAANARLAPLVEQWPRWQEALANVEASAARVKTAERALRSLKEKLAEAEGNRAKLGVALNTAQRAWESTHKASEEARQAMEAAPAAAKRSEREKLHELREGWTRLRQLHTDAQQAFDLRARLIAEADAANADAADALAARDAAAEKKRDAASKLEEAKAGAARIRSTQELSGYRSQLVAGEPCMLCGSLEHPSADDVPLNALLVDAESRVRGLEGELERLTTAIATESTRAGVAQKRAEDSGRAAAEAGKRFEGLRADWRAQREALADASVPEDVSDPHAAAVLEGGLTSMAAEDLALRAEIERREGLEKAANAAFRVAERSREDFLAAEKALQAAEKGLEEATRKLRESEAERKLAEESGIQSRRVLAPVFDRREGWEAELEGDPPAFIQRCAEQVAEWQRSVADRTTAESEREAHAKQIGAERERRDQTVEQLRAFKATVKELEEKARASQEARAKLLGGRPVLEVQRGLEEALSEEVRLRDTAIEAYVEAATNVTVLEERCANGARALEQAALDRLQTGDLLDAELAKLSLDEPRVRTLLAVDPQWLIENQARLKAIDEALATARTILTERQNQQAAHVEQGMPAQSPEELETSLPEAKLAVKTAQTASADLAAELKRDDAERARMAQEREIAAEQQKRTDTWSAIRELIGSADGRSFRVFAQSLTLEALLGPANTHLAELAPRYRLQRVPGQDLEIQIIDRDMADEVRAVSSLSGGESFLVSLGLALGLSSLSSTQTQVDTLFIDEGFGTLDSQSLEQVLEVLDGLQADGRQIGIISHVPGLAERLGAQVKVEKQGGGKSRISIVAA